MAHGRNGNRPYLLGLLSYRASSLQLFATRAGDVAISFNRSEWITDLFLYADFFYFEFSHLGFNQADEFVF